MQGHPLPLLEKGSRSTAFIPCASFLILILVLVLVLAFSVSLTTSLAVSRGAWAQTTQNGSSPRPLSLESSKGLVGPCFDLAHPGLRTPQLGRSARPWLMGLSPESRTWT